MKKKIIATIVGCIFLFVGKSIYAADGEIYNLKTLEKIYTLDDLMSMKNQMDVGLHQSKYGYELNNKVYKFKDVNNIYVQKRKNHSLKDILIQIQDTCKSEFNVNEKNDDNEEIFDVKNIY